MRMRCPSADAAMQRWWAQRMRASATPSTMRALMDMNSLVDVRDALPAIRVPTLVCTVSATRSSQVRGAQYLADRIPEARLGLLDGDDHFVSGDPDQILDPIERFVHDLPAGRAMRWRSPPSPRLPGRGQRTRRRAGRSRRPLRSGPGGRPVVLFDGPATAVRAGLAHCPEHRPLGVAIAEVPRDEARSTRTAYRSRSARRPGAAGILVGDSGVRDLLAGSGVVTEPAGVIGRRRRAAAVFRAVAARDGRRHRGRPARSGGPAAVCGQAVATSIVTGTPWVITSYTAERLRDCSTRAASFFASASPLTWNTTRIASYPLRTSGSRPRIPSRLMSPSTVEVTSSRSIRAPRRCSPGRW